MRVSADEVRNLSALARIALSDEEVEKLRGDIESILAYVDTIKKVELPEVPDDSVYLDEVNVMREDGEPHDARLHTETLLSQAPRREKNFVKVKKILG